MSELNKPFPGEMQQISNFFKGRQQLHKIEYKPELVQALALRGLMTIIPEEVEKSGILYNPQRMEVVDAVNQYQLSVNDLIDFQGSGRDNLHGAVNYLYQDTYKSYVRLQCASSRLGIEGQEILERVDGSTREVQYVEDWIRDKQKSKEISYTDVDIYRNLVNASCLVLATTTMFPGQLDRYSYSVQESKLSIENLQKKYDWLMNDDVPSDNVERAAKIMHNVAMAIQIRDDWSGQRVDRELRVPSYAVAGRIHRNGSSGQARRYIETQRKIYRQKARRLGLGFIPTRGTLTLAGMGERSSNFFSKHARKNGRLQDRIVRNQPFLREIMDILGEL